MTKIDAYNVNVYEEMDPGGCQADSRRRQTNRAWNLIKSLAIKRDFSVNKHGGRRAGRISDVTRIINCNSHLFTINIWQMSGVSATMPPFYILLSHSSFILTLPSCRTSTMNMFCFFKSGCWASELLWVWCLAHIIRSLRLLCDSCHSPLCYPMEQKYH